MDDRLKQAVQSVLRSLPPAYRDRLAIWLVRSLEGNVDFHSWERAGYHVTPNHFTSPVPELATLPPETFSTLSELPGIDMREAEQLALLKTVASEFAAEYDALPRTTAAPGEFFVENGAYGPGDAEMYYAMVRFLKPGRIVEIGSGWSTMVASKAMEVNEQEGHAGEITAIEPYPYPYFRAVVARTPRIHLDETQLQQVPLERFTELAPGDILFIDSSHVGKIGSDVLYEFLEILPRIRPGVVVHVHDIFLPADYPREWVLAEHRFWNEQYILQAFLAFNRGYEVLLAGSYLHRLHPEALRETIKGYDPAVHLPGSFWMRRV